MIPLKLQLKNFVSYGPTQEIDFEPYHLICLAGKNGHGKSALLDALTWVLWGQARKTGGQAKADEGLLRLGQDHMMVSLDFTCNNVLYRVRREYVVTSNKAHSSLEFGIVEPETGALKALTDKTIRATQAKIESMIGIDYEAFINSAFLKQGQSDEFSKKTPKERKDILATILGLDHFEKMRRLALDKAKDATTEKDHASGFIERLKTEIDQLPEAVEKLRLIEESLNQIAKQEEELATKTAELHRKNQWIIVQKSQVEKSTFQKEQLEKALTEQKNSILTEASHWRRIARQEQRKGFYQGLEQERSRIQAELANIQILAAKKMELKEAFLVKKDALSKHVQQMQELFAKAQEKLGLLQQAVFLELKQSQEKHHELEKKRTEIVKELLRLEQEVKLIQGEATPDDSFVATEEKKAERKKAYYHMFVAKAHSSSALVQAIEQKKLLLHSSEQAQCPLCEQKADRDALERKFSTQQSLAAHQLKRLSMVLKNLKAILVQEHELLLELKKKIEHSKLIQVKKEGLEKQHSKMIQEKALIEEQLTAQTALLIAKKQKEDELAQEIIRVHQSFQKSKEEESFKKMESDVKIIEEALEKIPYNPVYEKALHEKLSSLTQQSTQQSIILKEIALQEERKRSIAQRCQLAVELKKQIAFLAATLTELSAFQTEEIKAHNEEKQLAEAIHYLAKEKELLIHQKGALESHCTMLKQRQIEYTNQLKSLELLVQQVQEYTAIASAMSKDGIQALLIEDALPEIEQEANNLLSRLTDNQAHLSIESLRDLRSGRTKETLDIKISDAVGMRPYEMFSGGEAFRIDFSLRIAISKLLARRSGTALQTLIIDEGFGSQDEEGLSNIMEALYKIQDDFAKIIIVSHLPSMKEQFPVHFLVTKTSQGSIINVIEHC